ncbi:MAG TPA: hypothetical protein VK498_01580 [Ferruginibacter sp.]|nr:hypothetical protein [Ferruginibacter sp.]
MAKSVNPVVKIIGKFDDQVHVENKYGRHIRKVSNKKGSKETPAFKEQQFRTSFINKYASEINRLADRYAEHRKVTNFYHQIQKKFRINYSENRYLLLNQLKGLNVLKKPLEKLSFHEFGVIINKDHFDIELKIKQHPPGGKYDASCYSYDIIIITWKKGEDNGTAEKKHTQWYSRYEKVPTFDIRFKHPTGTEHWLLLLRIHLGDKNHALDFSDTSAMQIIETGTMNAKDELELKKKKAALEKERIAKQLKKDCIDDEERIMARK